MVRQTDVDDINTIWATGVLPRDHRVQCTSKVSRFLHNCFNMCLYAYNVIAAWSMYFFQVNELTTTVNTSSFGTLPLKRICHFKIV